MKHIIAAVFLAVTSIAAMGQTFDQASIAQKQRQQANAGAVQAKKTYETGGIYSLAKASSDCMESVKAGASSPYKCMGIEVVGLAIKDKTPANSNTKTGLDWFESKNITNRVYAYCFMFLGIKSDIACAQTFSTAKMASDGVLATTTAIYKGDLIGDAVPETPVQSAKRLADKIQGEMKGSAYQMVIAYRQSEMEGVTAAIQNCDMRVQDEDKIICGYMDAAGMYLDDVAVYKKKIQPSPYFQRQAFKTRMLDRMKDDSQSETDKLKKIQQIVFRMENLTQDSLRENP